MLYCKAAYYLEKWHKAQTTSQSRAKKTPATVVIGPINVCIVYVCILLFF